MIDTAASAVGGMVGMAGALGYGFKLLVDVVSRQLSVQNEAITVMEKGISEKLDVHITECRKCQSSSAEVAKEAAAATKVVVTAQASQTAEIIAAIREGPVKAGKTHE